MQLHGQRRQRGNRASARIPQKHPLKKCSRGMVLKQTTRERGCAGHRGISTQGLVQPGLYKGSSCVKMLEFESWLHHFLAL